MATVAAGRLFGLGHLVTCYGVTRTADGRGGWSSSFAGFRTKAMLGLRLLPVTMVPWCIMSLLEGVAMRTSTPRDFSR